MAAALSSRGQSCHIKLGAAHFALRYNIKYFHSFFLIFQMNICYNIMVKIVIWQGEQIPYFV
jgi:hypothetical protein